MYSSYGLLHTSKQILTVFHTHTQHNTQNENQEAADSGLTLVLWQGAGVSVKLSHDVVFPPICIPKRFFYK